MFIICTSKHPLNENDAKRRYLARVYVCAAHVMQDGLILTSKQMHAAALVPWCRMQYIRRIQNSGSNNQHTCCAVGRLKHCNTQSALPNRRGSGLEHAVSLSLQRR